MWREAALQLRVCPVRFITPDVTAVLDWFARTHELQATGFGPAMWRRTCLPGPGALGDQDAQLMASLDYVRDLSHVLMAEDRPARTPRDTSARKGRRRRG